VNVPKLEFLERYNGESLDELLAMAETYRIDSLVLAMESALQAKQEEGLRLSQEERVVLAIEGLEREVNNGGYHQFFFNSSRVYAAEIVEDLRLIGCPRQAEIAGRAVMGLGLRGAMTHEAIEEALEAGAEELEDALGALDGEYYACDEPIADRLFAFVKQNRERVMLAGRRPE
jgi:hypothetical protein